MLRADEISFTTEGKALIHNISLEFEPGILYGILGPNGSGKSTLLKNLAGIWKPSCGKVLWDQQNLHTLERTELSKTLSIVPQNPQCSFAFSVWEFVSMGRYPHQHSSSLSLTDIDTIVWALHTVNAWDFRERPITELSAGERQRVYIARSLATQSPILLLDEPTSSLDIGHQLEIWQLMRRLVQQDRVIIVTTHDLVMTQRFCDQIAVLNKGQCVGSGLYGEVVTPLMLQEVFGIVETAMPDPPNFHLANS